MGAKGNGEHVKAAALRVDKDRLLAHLTAALSGTGIRMLTGGGNVFVIHGLVSPRVANTLSLFVSPPDLADVMRTLRVLGWRDSPVPDPRRRLPFPLVHLVHDDWLAVLRLHATIPGFFADPVTTFDELWRRRGSMLLLDQRVPIVDRITTAALAGHNRLSGALARAAHGPNLDYLLAEFTRSFSLEERHELLAFCRTLGGTEELRSLLEGLCLEPGPSVVPSLEYTSWRVALEAPTDADRWLVARFEMSGVAARAVRPQLSNLGLAEQLRAGARMLGAAERVADRDAL
jgi:hypothetical protein